ncbi:MAG: MupA/Atu3671 family FMN-dependent luciferase-like monooxygenase [Pseudomonadota bacterium]
MDSNEQLSCYLIGSETLLTECGEHLISEGHQIHGVVTDSPRIRAWADGHQLVVIEPTGEYAQKLTQPFDYLFSITWLSIIPDDVLALPQKYAVNFHDGPLPGYAGLNTPAWALMNQEERYGITWHIIEGGVDEGRILKQELFDVGEEETSLSINTRCFAAALDSFPALIEGLVADSLEPADQDLSDRSYFGRQDRPAATGLIDWQSPADEIAALVRALHFGDYANPLASAKAVLTSSDGAIPAIIDSVDTDPGDGEETGVTVDCRDGQVSITGARTLTGQPIDLSTVTGVETSSGIRSSLDAMNADVAANETYWTRRLRMREAVSLELISSSEEAASPDVMATDISQGIPAFLALLSRLGSTSEFDVLFSSTDSRAQVESSAGFVSPQALLHVRVDIEQSGTELREAVNLAVSRVRKRGGFLNDLIGRHPDLAGQAELADGLQMPVGLSVSDGPADTTLPAGCAILLAQGDDGCQLVIDQRRVSPADARALLGRLQTLDRAMQAAPESRCCDLSLLTDDERAAMFGSWNETAVEYDATQCIHTLFEGVVARQPDATALVYRDESVSYQTLNERANALAHHLISRGLQPDELVGVHVERSIDLLIATLGVMKAGGAYVPLDPDFPRDRIKYMVEDAHMRLVISQSAILSTLPDSDAEVICVDQLDSLDNTAADNLTTPVSSSNLAYVIYTSGSTGNPKGVMVEHRNVVNFFVGMDDRVGGDEPGTWLAVTSLSFDISVLELFWTLTRGFKVVIYKEDRAEGEAVANAAQQAKPMAFGLFMWGNDDAPGSEKYKLMLDGARYFDENGFDAVWTPERHFHAFGGPYPNPSVTSAAIAAITKRVKIRSGSVVSPLHHPIRIAEDWAVVDNISDGRVGLSFASGWQPNDFVIKPENHKNNKQVMLEQIEIVKQLWRGEEVSFPNPMGEMVPVTTLPRPVQAELPVWLTTAGNPDSYRQAGLKGTNILTHLLGQSVEEVAEKVRIYRRAREEAGHEGPGEVTLMLHTFVGENDEDVRELVREPMKDYLRSSMKLVLDFAWAFPAFKRPGGDDASPDDVDLNALSEDEMETILDFAFDRYFETSGLFGTLETCESMIDRCKGAGIDEIACLLDFGVPTEDVMGSLPRLGELRRRANAGAESADASATGPMDYTLAAQLERHNVTHMQCTPSMARMLSFDDDARQAMGKLSHLMVGGEAFPNALATDLKRFISGRVTNMYGPTETTIWSTTQDVLDPDNIPIGRPIANTEIYILDGHLQAVPPGTAGDLYIGGDGVVRGYFEREELTAERFRNVDINGEEQRLYWTGDLARFRSDGVIEFLGRIDHQVKIRGYRIELGEIESQLSKHPMVREAVLLLREDNPGDQRLVAYVVAATQDLDVSALKDRLRERLPEYMVPSDFVKLPVMPLTPNGKIDRKQLPSPQGVSQVVAAEYVAPASELESTIAAIWQDTLKLDQVGMNDNFFDLGGHSLLIVRVHQQLKTQVDKPIGLTDLYRFPTIASLTEYLTSDKASEGMKKSTDRAARRRQRLGLRGRKKSRTKD